MGIGVLISTELVGSGGTTGNVVELSNGRKLDAVVPSLSSTG